MCVQYICAVYPNKNHGATHPVFVEFEKMKISHCTVHVFRCLIHFQSLFGSSTCTMNDGTRKSLCKLLHDVCQAIKMHFIVLRYCFGVTILGTMFMKFLFSFLLSICTQKSVPQAWDLLENWHLFSSTSFIANTVC